MSRIGDVLNKIKNQDKMKHCFLPQNLISSRAVDGFGELTIGFDKASAEQFTLQALSDEPDTLAGILVLFDREEYNQAIRECGREEKEHE